MWRTQATGTDLSEVKTLATSFTDWEGTCLAHHGIRGQKWGVRRYQNPDGTLTEEGKRRFGKRLEKYQTRADNWRKNEATMRYGRQHIIIIRDGNSSFIK